ncbi:MAG TPA: hypothetical protein VJM74_02695 [Nitrososphaeraceae archaeon]|nr:hypothetical protein [Nitrososphaeraceae archaeon]
MKYAITQNVLIAVENVKLQYRLGVGLTRIIPFQRLIVKKPKEIITTKLVIVMVVIAVVKIAVLVLWI